MNKRIILTPTRRHRQEIVIEGNELVVYTYSVDPDQPRSQVRGTQYYFNTQMLRVDRMPGRKIPTMVGNNVG